MDILVILLLIGLGIAGAVAASLWTRAKEAAARHGAEARFEEARRSLQALAAERDRAQAERLAAVGELAAARQQLSDGELRIKDFERLKEESLLAAKAAMLSTAQELSTKLIEDHRRENAESKKEGEERVRLTTEQLMTRMGEITTAVAALNGQVSEKAQQLDTVWRALSNPSGAGQIAEIGLANTLKSFGLEAGRDYLLQMTTQDDETGRRLRPDAVVFLPASSVLVIDCKASKFLLDIARAEGTPDEAEAYQSLSRTMNLHLKQLAEKDYRSAILGAWKQGGREGEITRILSVMYLPNEAALEKLNRADPEFLAKARRAQIIPVGPAGLHCVASLVSVEITLAKQVENQDRIVAAAQGLLEAITVMLGYTAAVGKGLRGAAESFGKLSASINGRLLSRARGLARLGVQPPKPLPGNIPSFGVVSHEPDMIDGEASEVGEELPMAEVRTLIAKEGR